VGRPPSGGPTETGLVLPLPLPVLEARPRAAHVPGDPAYRGAGASGLALHRRWAGHASRPDAGLDQLAGPRPQRHYGNRLGPVPRFHRPAHLLVPERSNHLRDLRGIDSAGEAGLPYGTPSAWESLFGFGCGTHPAGVN